MKPTRQPLISLFGYYNKTPRNVKRKEGPSPQNSYSIKLNIVTVLSDVPKEDPNQGQYSEVSIKKFVFYHMDGPKVSSVFQQAKCKKTAGKKTLAGYFSPIHVWVLKNSNSIKLNLRTNFVVNGEKFIVSPIDVKN